jgi:hypothetical protein
MTGQPITDREVLALIESSRSFAAVNGLLQRLARAAETSRLRVVVQDARAWWAAAAVTQRSRTAGIVFFVAGAIAIVTGALQPVSGWFWAIIPLWSLLAGSLLLVSSLRSVRKIDS